MADTPNRILLVEDDAGLAELLGEVLQPHGLVVTAVATGRACVDWLQAHDADLLLVDYSLPDMTGAALVDELRRTGRSHPFVVTTGHGDEEVAVQLMKLGAFDYLVKDARLFQRLPGVVLRALKEVASARRLEAAESQLRQSHEMISKLTAQVPGVVYQYRLYPDGRSAFPFSSPGIKEIYEVTPEEVREDATPVYGRLHPADLDDVVAAIRRSAEALELFHCEFRVVLPRQGERWRLCDATPERLADGSTLWYGIITDITERKRTEAALARDEAELSAIYESAPVMLLLIDGQLKVRRLNRAAVEYCGTTASTAVTAACGELIGCLRTIDGTCTCDPAVADGSCRLRQIILAALREGRSCQRVEVTAPIVRAGKSATVTMLASAAPVTVEGEGLVLLSLEDITPQKLSESRIREQAALLDVTRDAIVVMDLDGRVNYWNRGAEELYGWSASEAKGVRFESLVFDPAVKVEAIAAWQAIRRDGKWSGELRQRHRSGEVRITLCRGVQVHGPAGEVHSLMFTASDITEAKRMEVQFLRAQRLDSLGSLAGGVAHDLNNVFTPILMSVEMLRVTSGASRDRELIDLLDESARRGSDIVRQLLMFGRGSDSPRGEVQVAMLLREIRRMLQETFPKNIELAIEPAGELWLVSANHTQLHQVLLNLCVNARDAMPQGGRLALTAENKIVDAALAASQSKIKPGPYVLLRVVDNGSGVPPDLLERIFDPFFTTKPFGQGTGLGLSTALGIVRSHGGFITVKSEPGHGSEFCVYLPAIQPDAAAVDGRPRVAVQEGRNELVLVVDDEVNIQAMLEMALTRKGYRVARVSDGLEAVAFFAERGAEVDLVVTDMMMPRGDGLSTVRSLRTLRPRLPVVAISGVPGHRIELEALPAPRVRFLPKPFGIEDLLVLVREALDEVTPAPPPAKAQT